MVEKKSEKILLKQKQAGGERFINRLPKQDMTPVCITEGSISEN